MNYLIWMVWRFLKSGQNVMNHTTILSLLGMVLGVASLVVGMAVVSGFETTLRNSVIDTVGHVLVMKRAEPIYSNEKFVDELKKIVPNMVAQTPFVYLEAIVAHNKKVGGVMVHGIDTSTYKDVLRIDHRILMGDFQFLKNSDGIDAGVVGKALADFYQLKIGDVFSVVMPISKEFNSSSIQPRLKKFFVSGVIDLGRHDWNQRFIFTHISSAQEFAEIGNQVMGYRLKLTDENDAPNVSTKLNSNLGYNFWTRDWRDVSSNLFKAIQLEKLVIFFILMIIVIAASVNISSTLFVSVIKKYKDVSILKTVGADKKFLMKLFTIQGLMIGFIGTLLGVVLGIGLCYGFLELQTRWSLLPVEVYRLEKIDIEFRWTDMLAILTTSLFICFLSTLAPARRGSKLSAVEGLKYE